MMLGVSLVLMVYGGVNVYIGRKLFRLLEQLFPSIHAVWFAIVYSLIALSLIVSFLPVSRTIKRIANWIGSYWMGAFVYLWLFYVILDIVLLAATLMTIIRRPIEPSVHFYAGLLVVLLTIGFVSYGIAHARKLKHVAYAIKTNAAKHATPMKIVLVSDLHLGAVNSEKRLPLIVKKINEQKPDIVCVVGDIFNDDYTAIKNPQQAIEQLKSIAATYGVYASLGNHDGGKTFDQMVSFLEQSNIQLLRDEYTIIDERLALFGRLDPSPIGGYGAYKRKDITYKLKELDPNMPVVVMDHTPSHLEQYSEQVDLILAGHTHKGQVFPGNLITKKVFTVDYGHYQKDKDSPHVIVSSGAGTWGMPMRVGSSSEVVSIQIN